MSLRRYTDEELIAELIGRMAAYRHKIQLLQQDNDQLQAAAMALRDELKDLKNQQAPPADVPRH